jgi:2-polyprenyl-6-methoxyphenol hydroxylase-like FAD-dependent oxidoreductase
MIKKNSKIGIVGAGTTGVYLAGLLSKQGYKVDLFEKASSPRTDGCGILLVQDGMKALNEGNPSVCQKIIQAGSPVTYFEFRNLKGGLADSHSVSYEEDELPGMLVHRQAILQALLDDLPPNSLHVNHQFISLEQTDKKVTAYFAHGQQWEGDLLIGIDGIFSRVRPFVVPNVKPLFYLGDVVWRGVVKDDHFCPENTFIVYIRGRGIYANFFSLGKGKTHWGFFLEKEQHDFEKKKPRPDNVLIPEAELEKLPPAPLKIIQDTPVEDIVCNFSYDINPLPYLYQGRVLLMGDAAHASSSTRARGMTSGLEDALALARHFAQGKDIEQVLFDFQAERLPIVHEYQRTSREMSLNIGRQQRKKAA